MAILCRLKRRQVSWRKVSGGPSRSSTARWGGFSSLITDSGIEPGINDVGQDLKNDDRSSDQKKDAHDQGRVAIGNAVQKQTSHARPGKDALRDHGSGQKQG